MGVRGAARDSLCQLSPTRTSFIPHLFLTALRAIAIGKRKQAGKTYFETHLSEFKDCSLEQLVTHALRALRACLSADTELDKENCAVAVVGKDQKFKLCSQGEVEEYLSVFADEDRGDDDEEDHSRQRKRRFAAGAKFYPPPSLRRA